MPSPHAKKHREKTVKVKREPSEVKPLSEYVDDRLELIKQAFACLKPKTIKAVTPKFMQKESLESIQEKCLDEVLGISKKRLLAIINDTSVDGPSSSSSSDDEDIVEHISLDEISSDEDTKGKTFSKKNNGDLNSVAGQQMKTEKKEYSVLELLELQARARAIRSQLALEPVTKIELDGDEEEIPPVKGKGTEKKRVRKSSPGSPKKRDRKPEKKGSHSKASHSKQSNGSSSSSKAEANKRCLTMVPEAAATDEGSARVVKVTNCYSKQQLGATEDINVEVKNDRLRRQEDSRESSPEVMPIVASPVTLCISSEDEGGAATKNVATVTREHEGTEKVQPGERQEPAEDGEIDEESQADEQCDESAVIENRAGDPSISKDEFTISDTKYDSDVLCVQLEDDCIDLECDEPIDEGEDEASVAPRESEDGKEIEAAAVEIVDSSADEEIDPEKGGASSSSKSWGVRWLESSKVTKILATSKLGNQVRRKIQLSKKSTKQQEATPGTETVPTTNAAGDKQQGELVEESEVGSLEHFRKIVDEASSKGE